MPDLAIDRQRLADWEQKYRELVELLAIQFIVEKGGVHRMRLDDKLKSVSDTVSGMAIVFDSGRDMLGSWVDAIALPRIDAAERARAMAKERSNA